MENNSGRCSINMNGEKIDLIFGMPACEKFYLDIAEGRVLTDDEGNILSSTGVACLLYAGYFNGCVYNNAPVKHTVGTFLEFMEAHIEDANVAKELVDAGTCFKNSTSVIKYLQRKQGEVDAQKKRIMESLTQSKSEGSGT